MKVFLLRHARSAANERRVWTGQTDIALSKSGIAEQLSVCARYAYPRGDLYFSSPLSRCFTSLELVYGRPADYLLPEFMECALGSLEGTQYTSLDDDVNYIDWINEPALRLNGGESFNEFTSRVCRGFLKVIAISEAAGTRSAAAVLHGNVMRAILHSFVDSSVPHQLWQIPNCGGYLFEYGGNSPLSLSYERVPGFLFH